MNMPRMPNGIQHTVGFSNGFGSGKRKRQSRRLFPVGLTLPWLEKVRAAYLMSGCDLAITLFAAQKFSGLRPEDADYPTLDLVEEIAVSMPLDASIRVRVRKEVAEVLLVKEIEKLNLRGVVPSLAAVYAMYEAFEPSSRCIGYRGRIAWVQRFRKRWGLSRRAWSCQPEIEKGQGGAPNLGPLRGTKTGVILGGQEVGSFSLCRWQFFGNGCNICNAALHWTDRFFC